ncbi:MAG: class II aldolase/adducin family protein [Candidatus Edwardsbacteria bacterium]|nr:class II aldolase/adducin family protein [Candidatus Edwardsbacteria bacterium]
MIQDLLPVQQQIITACRRLDQLGFVPATDGNVSARIGRDEILITPTMVPKRTMQQSQLLVVGMDGKVKQGTGKPTSEMRMHLTAYWLRPDIAAIVHAHPPVATGFAAARLGLTEPILPEAVLTLGPVPLAQYATPSTEEVAKSIEKLIALHDALLLANHGVPAVGSCLEDAMQRMERVEHLAKVSLVAALLGGAAALNAGDIAKLKAAYQQPDTGAQA